MIDNELDSPVFGGKEFNTWGPPTLKIDFA